MAFRPLYTISGAPPFTKAYGIAAAEAWSVGDVVAWNASGVLLRPTADNVDVLGIAAEAVTAGAAGGPVTTEAVVYIFTPDVIWATTQTAGAAPVTADIGRSADLDRVAAADWRIHNTAVGTAATPQFRVVDIDTIRNEFHVVIDPDTVTAVYQWINALV